MIPGGPVATLFLDAGGVLVDPDWVRVAGVLARHGIRADPAALAAAEPAAKRTLDLPQAVRSTDDRRRGGLFFHAVVRCAGVDADPAAMDAADADLRAEHARSNLWCVVPPGVEEALESLRAGGIRLAVVSNADGSVEDLLRRVGLGGFFAAVVDSGRVGFEKPDPRIFGEALRRSSADPASTLHAGDFYEIDVLGARAAGLRAALVDPAGANGDRECPRFPSVAALAGAVLRSR